MKLLPITSGGAGGYSGSLLRREPIKTAKFNEASSYKFCEMHSPKQIPLTYS